MSEVFSRTYLQGLPAAYRKGQFESAIIPILSEVRRVAREGKTSYAFSILRAGQAHHPQTALSLALWTAEELLPLFKDKFPDCAVNYEEAWIDETPTRRCLSKRIVIDWS
jgi:hypothetical protein